eukprot:3798933-Amphidinium_carterae.1
MQYSLLKHRSVQACSSGSKCQLQQGLPNSKLFQLLAAPSSTQTVRSNAVVVFHAQIGRTEQFRSVVPCERLQRVLYCQDRSTWLAKQNTIDVNTSMIRTECRGMVKVEHSIQGRVAPPLLPVARLRWDHSTRVWWTVSLAL